MYLFKTIAAAALLALVLTACGSQPTMAVDGRASDGDGIVGGKAFAGLPAVGAITYAGEAYCSGTLVGPRTVVTAGHCVYDVDAADLEFVIGPKADEPEMVLAVAAATPHPDFDFEELANDIGVLRLAEDAPIEPLGILSAMDESWKGRSLLFIGYGYDDGFAHTGAGVKRAVWMTITDVTELDFTYEHADANTCNGDSGGPALARDDEGRFWVAGVTSYGDPTCSAYGVDTRVDPYLEFIATAATTDPCRGETYEGRCEEGRLVWCELGEVYEVDCASRGQECVYSEAAGYFDCRE